MEIKFCRRCGTSLQDKGRGAFVCANGHHLFYKSAIACNLMLLNTHNELLVGVRGFEPDKGCWDLPGGFCDYSEDFDSAVQREIDEELGLQPSDYTEPQYLMNGIDTYMWENEAEPVLNVAYWARLKGSPDIKASDDLSAVMWVPLKDMDLSKFAPMFKSVTRAVPMLQKIVF